MLVSTLLVPPEGAQEYVNPTVDEVTEIVAVPNPLGPAQPPPDVETEDVIPGVMVMV